MIFRSVLLATVVWTLVGCALPKVDLSGQSLVPEDDVVAIAQTREGLNLLKAGRNLEAEIQFRKALILIPQSAPLMQNLGIALFQQSRFDEALEVFNAVPATQNTLISRMWYARSKIELGQVDEGVKLLDTQLNEALEKSDFLGATQLSRTLASIFYGLGEEAEALSYSWLSYGLDYGSAETVLRHSRLLMACGLEKKANEVLKAFGGERFSNVVENVALTGVIAASASGEDDRARQILLERFLSGSADGNISSPAQLMELHLGLRESLDEGGAIYFKTNLKERLFWPASLLNSLRPYLAE